MASTIILSDNGVSSGTSGYKITAGNDGVLILQTTTSGGTATNAIYVDNNQNVGFGVVPTILSTYKLLEIGANGNCLLGWGGSDFSMTSGVYYTSGNWKWAGTNSLGGSQYEQYNGAHYWAGAAPTSHTAGNNASLTTNLTLSATGILALQGGNASATGVGVAFPSSQSASNDANTLDDYEEGTWTPTVFTDGGGQSVTYSVQRGTYTKIGRSVSISWYVSWSAFTGGSNGVRVGNLPFTSQNTGPGVYYTGANAEHGPSITYPAGYTTLTYEIAQASTSILPVINGSGQGTVGLTKTYVGTGSGYMIGSVTYDAT